MVIKNKKGWIRIVEVFVSILLVMGVLFVIIEGRIMEKTETDEIYETEISILRDIQLNYNLRSEILNANIPLEWEDFDSNLPNTKTRINELNSSNIECNAKLCELTDKCILNNSNSNDIYAESVVISANENTYNPRQLKLFCWKNEL